jgi:hypothetical protein
LFLLTSSLFTLHMILMILFIFRVQCSGFLFRVIVIAINTLVLFGNMKRKIVFITEYLSVFSKQRGRQEKQKDKEDAQKYNHIHTATFDLEAVLPTPCSLVSQAYYKRKLSSYNFTVSHLLSART